MSWDALRREDTEVYTSYVSHGVQDFSTKLKIGKLFNVYLFLFTLRMHARFCAIWFPRSPFTLQVYQLLRGADRFVTEGCSCNVFSDILLFNPSTAYLL